MPIYERQRQLGQAGSSFDGKAQASNALADTLSGFGRVALDTAKQGHVALATKEAQAEDVSGGIEKRSEYSSAGRAYNEIVQAGYGASIKNAYTKRIGEISSEFAGDPEGFDKVLSAYQSEMLNGVDPSIRQVVALDFEQASIRPKLRITENFKKNAFAESMNEIADAASETMDSGALAAREGNADGVGYTSEAIEALSLQLEEAGDHGAASALRAEYKDRVQKQVYLGEADRAIKAGQGKEFVKSFIDNPPKDLTPEEVDAHAATMLSMNSRYGAIQAEESSEQSIALSRQISNLKIKANTGMGDPEAIHKETEELFNNGDLNEPERTSILTKLLKADQNRTKDAIDFAAVGQRLQGDDSVVVDPALQDKFYTDHYVSQFEGQPPEVIEALNVSYVERMKRVPSALKSQIQTYVMSGDSGLIKEAANMVDKVDQIPGLVDSVFGSDQQAFVQNVLELSESLTGTEAVDLARKLTDPNDKARIDTRSQYIKDEKLSLKYRDQAQDIFDGGWFGEATNLDGISGSQVSKEYGQLFEAYYKAGMSEDKAGQEASKRVKRNWSTWNGRVMKYAPDSFYSVAGSSDYIMDQLVKDVSDNLATDEAITKDQLVLVSTEETSRTAGKGQPVYRIGIVKDGSFQYTELPYWMPDTDAEVKRVEAANKSIIDQASSKTSLKAPGKVSHLNSL